MVNVPNLAILKAVVEHVDEDTYFKSFSTLGIWIKDTLQLGLIRWGQSTLEVTELGQKVYDSCHLDKCTDSAINWDEMLLEVADNLVAGLEGT